MVILFRTENRRRHRRRVTTARVRAEVSMSRDDREYHETVNGAHAALLSYARRYADFGLAPEADLLGSQEPYPPSLRGTPIVIDTDIGGDPDDAVALAVAARQVPQLVPVVTSDEHEGQRSIPPLATRRLWPRT